VVLLDCGLVKQLGGLSGWLAGLCVLHILVKLVLLHPHTKGAKGVVRVSSFNNNFKSGPQFFLVGNKISLDSAVCQPAALPS
jgi:hypothetical protein